MEYDFSGYVTKNDVKCTDGRVIRQGAFAEQDGEIVPLVWHHNGVEDPKNILGQVLLENRPDGVYGYAKFNTTESGQTSKKLVHEGNIKKLSIHARELIERAKNVMHGKIKEVSLVMAGANPGAFIDNVVLSHDGYESELEDEAIIGFDIPIDLPKAEVQEEVVEHAEDEDETVADVLGTLNEKQKDVVAFLIKEALSHDNDDDNDSDDADDDDDVNHEDKSEEIQHDQEGSSMTHNLFEDQKKDTKPDYTLTHDDMKSIMKSAQSLGSIKMAVESYALTHGIDNIDLLFPDAKAITTTPEFLKRRTEWVDKVMSGTRATPFSRIKTLMADITMEEARAKGYVKGNFKKEEFFSILKRTTTPQTVYKKQSLHRDDVVDITDFDVVAWLRAEMRLMLEEEIARAILIGDGRSNADEDKINESNIRPIATDSELFQTTIYVNIDDSNSSAEEIIDAVTLQRRHYRGSGNPTFFTSETLLAKMLLIKDGMQRRVYQSVADLSVALRVKEIVTVEVFEEVTEIVGIIVNLQDYNVGADKGGQVSLFDDFDIDYNKLKYLIETRISGALVKLKSALVIRKVASTAALVVPVAPTFEDNEVTVATTTGVTYKNKLTGTTLTTASPVELGVDESLTVIAVPASASYYFATSADDEWTFTYQA